MTTATLASPAPSDVQTGPFASPATPPGQPLRATGNRLASIDAYRGMVMLLMMGEVLQFRRMHEAFPNSRFWSILTHHQTHTAWAGCSLHDLIQPSFSFLVGVALPFSLARRSADGQTQWRRTLHAFWRALVLVLLGVFLRSVGRKQTYWTFEDTLSQIGLGYGFLYLLALRSRRVQWAALGVILVGYWLAFALYPLPGPDFDWARVHLRPGDPSLLSGFAAHWGLNTNVAWRFDTWFLNLLPREKPFNYNDGGYSTLSFIPTLGTMILGLIAGNVLRNTDDRFTASKAGKVAWLLIAGLIALAAGWGLGALGVCPVVKKIWTPSWVLFSGGWCFLFLGAYYAVMDCVGWRRWGFWLIVVGMNSIAAYCIAHLFERFIYFALPRHLGRATFEAAGSAYEPLVHGAAILLVEWVILYWMYRRKIFLRI